MTVHEVAELDVTEHTSRGHHQHPSGPAGLGLHACGQPAILLSTPTCRGFEDIVVSVDEETEPRPKAALNSLFLPGLCFSLVFVSSPAWISPLELKECLRD